MTAIWVLLCMYIFAYLTSENIKSNVGVRVFVCVCVCVYEYDHMLGCVCHIERHGKERLLICERRGTGWKRRLRRATQMCWEKRWEELCLPGSICSVFTHRSNLHIWPHILYKAKYSYFWLLSPALVCEQIEALKFQREVYISELEEWMSEAEKHIQSLRYVTE